MGAGFVYKYLSLFLGGVSDSDAYQYTRLIFHFPSVFVFVLWRQIIFFLMRKMLSFNFLGKETGPMLTAHNQRFIVKDGPHIIIVQER